MKIFLVLFLASSVSAATYYVDQSAGNDANNGSIGSPWKNCPGMTGSSAYTGGGSLTAGDTVYFDSGDTWNVNSDTDGGLTLEGGVHYIGNQWPTVISGRWPLYGAKIRASAYCESGIVRFNEDHASIATWIEGFELDGNNTTNTGVDINHAHFVVGMIQAVKRVQSCYVHDLSGNGADGYFRYGIIISDASSDASAWVANVEILDTEMARASRDGICLYPSNTGIISNVTVRGCVAHGASNDASYAEGHGILIKALVKDSTIENCLVTNVDAAAVFINGPEPPGTGPGPTNITVRYNVLKCGSDDGVIRFFGSGNKTVDVYGNIVLENEVTGGYNMAGCSGTMNIHVYNNTFYDSFVDIGNPTATGTLDFRNNIVVELDDVPYTDSGSDVDTHTDNLYYRVAGGTTFVDSGGTTYTAGTLTTFEATALGVDPVFKNTSNLPNSIVNLVPDNDGLSLQSSSTAIDAGVDLGSPFNSSVAGVVRGSLWDIGAYEFVDISPIVYKSKFRGLLLKSK